MIGLSVVFNGIELNEYITVLDGYTTHGGANWSPEYDEIPGKNGADFKKMKYKYKMIKMPFLIHEDIENKYDMLSKILNAKEPKTLLFGNNPGKMYYAITTGDFNFKEVNEKTGSGTITWLIPDGLAHSISEEEFAAEVNENGVMEATIVNEGTESVPINYEITHNHENGYIGIVSEYGAMQFGHIGEVDAEEQSSEMLLEYNADEMLSNMASGGTFSSSYANNGALAVNEHNGVRYLELINA